MTRSRVVTGAIAERAPDFAAGRKVIIDLQPAKHDHLVSRPDRRGFDARIERTRREARPGIALRIVAAAIIQLCRVISHTAPDNHFSAGPNRCKLRARRRRIHLAHQAPVVAFRIVASAIGIVVVSEEIRAPAPDDHFAPRPHGAMKPPGRWSGGRRNWTPALVLQIKAAALA